MSTDTLIGELSGRMHYAETRYGPFASTHEAIGVALEEWRELLDAVRLNDMAQIEAECLDMAAVLLRMVYCIRDGGAFAERSVK